MTVLLKIEGNRGVVQPPLTRDILNLTRNIEGVKKWLKGGGLSFEITAANMENFRKQYPDAVIEGEHRLDFGAQSEPVKDRGIKYEPKLPPMPYQTRAIDLSHKMPEFGLFMEMGTGKTYVIIHTIGQLWCEGKIHAVLIVAPKGVHAQWLLEEIPKHLGESVPRTMVLWNKIKTNMPSFDRDRLTVFSVNEDAIRTPIGYRACEEFIIANDGRVMLVIDESQSIKSMSSLKTEAAIELGKMVSHRRILTGTPVANNVLDVFSQLYFLNPRIIGYKYSTSFQREYCVMGGPEGRDIVGHRNIEQLWRRMDPFTFRVTKEEADLQLPPKHYVRTPFEMSEGQSEMYRKIREDFFLKLESGQIADAKHAGGSLMKLQQVTNGFLIMEDDSILTLPNPRMEACRRIVQEREGKIVIWARFIKDIENLSAEFGKIALSYEGSTSSTARKHAVQQFLDPSSSIRILIANQAAAGVGLNLQGDCRTVIYYSNSFNAVDRWQSEDRVHRRGMRQAITYFDIICRGTTDTKILANLRNKKSLSDLLLDDIRQLFGD